MLLAKLPKKENYQQLMVSAEQDTFIWEDKQTPLVKIVAPARNPWEREWAIKIIKERDIVNDKFPVSLTIRCYFPGQGRFLPANIIRKEITSRFFICEDNSFHSFGFLLESGNNFTTHVQSWLGYFFTKQSYR